MSARGLRCEGFRQAAGRRDAGKYSIMRSTRIDAEGCPSAPPLSQLDVFDNTSSSLIVAVRVRPILKSGVRASEANQKDILRVMNDKIVVVMDPDDEKVACRLMLARRGESRELQIRTSCLVCSQSAGMVDSLSFWKCSPTWTRCRAGPRRRTTRLM